jgi:hypothetical protein
MVTPTFADYVELLFTLFERFWQQETARSHRGRPFVYQQKALIVFFVGPRSWDRPLYALRGGLRGAGASSTDSKIAANIERGFCPKKRSAAVVPSGRVRKKL